MITKADLVDTKLAYCNVESICLYCHRDGCANSDGDTVPCLCDGTCEHDNRCACDCHQWAKDLIGARNLILSQAVRIKDLVRSGDRMSQALLESHCSCPNHGPCECERQQSIDNWEETSRVP